MKTAPEFHEAFDGGGKVDPLHNSAVEFDYDQVDRHLARLTADVPENHREALGFALVKLLEWICCRPGKLEPFSTTKCGLRAVGALWVLKPQALDGVSVRTLAKQLGVANPTLSRHSGSFSRTFNVVNRGQSHAWNRGKGVGKEAKKNARE